MNVLSRNIAAIILVETILSVLIPASIIAEPFAETSVSRKKGQTDISITIGNSNSRIDIENAHSMDDDFSGSYSFTLEHLKSALPNTKIQKSNLYSRSTSASNTEINFGGTTFSAYNQLNNQIDLSHKAYIMYYEILNDDLSVDIGLNLMKFKGNIYLQSKDLSGKVKLTEYVPTIFGKATYKVPQTTMTLGIEGSALSISANKISEYKFYLGWQSDSALGTEIGYHYLDADWNEVEHSIGDISYKGLYANITFHY